MQTWIRISLLLCTFGFFREMRPSEPFGMEYLSGPWRNITSDQVTKELYPVGTYAVLAQLVVVFLFTDILRYKPVIVLSAGSGIALFAGLLWAKTLWQLQIGQLFYGAFMATEVAYYTYIYAKVDRERYQIVTGHARSAILCGKFLGGVLGQVFVSTDTMDYLGLHYISFGSQVISFFVALSLPSVRKSMYFYADSHTSVMHVPSIKSGPDIEMTVEDAAYHEVIAACDESSTNPTFSWRNAFRLLVQHTVSAYTNLTVVEWSLWWAIANCGQVQIVSYVQLLWKEIDPNHENLYNGGVEAAVTLLGAVGAMIAGLMNSSRHKEWTTWILTIASLLMGVFTITSSVTHIIWIAYIMYILYGILYYFVITIASAIVAKNLSDDSFALIFGINTLVALILQTILTMIVVTDTVGYGLSGREQFLVYGIYHIVLALLYGIAVVVRFIYRIFRNHDTVTIDNNQLDK